MSCPSFASPDKTTIRSIFDQIAFRYDPINTLLSLGIDESWRKRAVQLILKSPNSYQSILDLGVGTGKFLKKFPPRVLCQMPMGIDFSHQMLKRAQKELPNCCRLLEADIHDLPLKENSFDLVISSFTLRSVKDRTHFFQEVYRVLRSGGEAAFLCLTRPVSRLGRALYLPYLRFYLPLVGGMLVPDKSAYQFLSESIQTFPGPGEIVRQMEVAGFRNSRITPFTFGIATLMQVQK